MVAAIARNPSGINSRSKNPESSWNGASDIMARLRCRTAWMADRISAGSAILSASTKHSHSASAASAPIQQACGLPAHPAGSAVASNKVTRLSAVAMRRTMAAVSSLESSSTAMICSLSPG
jgi:hypothetical protein